MNLSTYAPTNAAPSKNGSSPNGPSEAAAPLYAPSKYTPFKYSPSNQSPQALEYLFVGRHQILDAMTARVESAATGATRNHTLLLGPRGSGKTHLLALGNARTAALRDAGTAVQVSWPAEDLYWVTNYQELLAEIVGSLHIAPDVEPGRHSWQGLEAILVHAAASDGVIVVLIENLDQLLAAIGELGQQRLRRFCQDDAAIVLVATATSTTRDLGDPAAPFYGFFTTSALEPLPVRYAVDMLTRIARSTHDNELVDFLGTERGIARVSAIKHLVGSQPRVWATVAAGATAPRLDELVDLMLGQFDDLTPHYQSQIARLSPQQRRVMHQLIRADHPLHVAEIAELLDADQRSVAKTISELRDRDWIKPTESLLLQFVDRRRSYYEPTDPLARLMSQIRSVRARSIEPVIEFVKMWFDQTGLDDSPGSHRERSPELNRPRSCPVSSVELLGTVDDALAQLSNGDASAVIGLPHAARTTIESWLGASDSTGDLGGAIDNVSRMLNDAALARVGRSTPAPRLLIGEWVRRTERLLDRADATDRPSDLGRLANWHIRNGAFETAQAIIELLPPGTHRAAARHFRDPVTGADELQAS